METFTNAKLMMNEQKHKNLKPTSREMDYFMKTTTEIYLKSLTVTFFASFNDTITTLLVIRHLC